MSQDFQPRKSGGIGRFLGIGCLGLIGLSLVVGLISATVASRKIGSQSNSLTTSAKPPTPATPTQKLAEGSRLIEKDEYVGDLEKGIALLEQIDPGASEFKAAQPILKKAKAQKAKEEKEFAILGEKPLASGWDGSVLEVERALEKVAKDPDSLTYEDWSKVYKLNDAGQLYWAVDVNYRAKNSFGAMTLDSKTFLIRRGQVVKILGR